MRVWCSSLVRTPGPAAFEADRIIPSHLVKDLLFGHVPTIFQLDGLKLDLEFGGEQEIRGTLNLLKCDQETVERYVGRRDHVRSGECRELQTTDQQLSHCSKLRDRSHD